MNLAPTPSNLKAAGKLRERVVQSIRLGSFDYAAFFPDSPRAPQLGKLSFDAFADLWLEGQRPALQFSTWQSYQRILAHHWRPRLGQRPLADITATELLAAAGAAGFPTAKTRNNCISPLRLLFAAAHMDGLIQTDPTARLKSQRIQREPPDPFTPEEMDSILRHIAGRYHAQHWHYFDFAFATGMRPSEMIALRWSDIDWHRGTATVRRAKVRHQVKPTTKTARVREVELGARALAALERQRPYTQLKGAEIFENPNTGAPYLDERPLREHVWTPTIKALGLRHRPLYTTRHTRATQILMSGAQPAWGAAQLGHSLPMFLTIYARWINAADQGRELGKVEAMLGEGARTTTTTRRKPR